MAKRKTQAHQPGRNTNSYEGRQSSEVGQRAKDAFGKGNEFTGKHFATNSLAANEAKMSISGSKYRERSRSKK